MQNIFNLKENMEYITINLNKKNFIIRISGTVYKPYFCGKDVCELLQYPDAKQALQNHVDSDDKKMLKELVLTSNAYSNSVKTRLGKTYQNFSHNEGKSIYITESGVYSLLLQSPAKFEKEYKKLICRALLLSMRKNREHFNDTKQQTEQIIKSREKNTKNFKYNKSEKRRDIREEIITFFKLHTTLCIC